jgi:hypothetical protein
MLTLFATVFVQQSFAQENTNQSQLPQLLSSYYSIKNALVAGNANMSSAKAEEFVKTLNGIDKNIIIETSRNGLLKEANQISETKDIKQQREYFASLSTNMFALAKVVKLTTEPIYEDYCPMKKAYWLSREKAIKNPYFGNAMLTCGNVAETLK